MKKWFLNQEGEGDPMELRDCSRDFWLGFCFATGIGRAMFITLLVASVVWSFLRMNSYAFLCTTVRALTYAPHVDGITKKRTSKSQSSS